MGLRFVFMLTRNDMTVEDAEQHLETALAAGVHHIGFKDVGLPFDRLKQLNERIRAGGATSYLEVVSVDRESELASARAAVDIGVDILLGGTNVDGVLPILAGVNIRCDVGKANKRDVFPGYKIAIDFFSECGAMRFHIVGRVFGIVHRGNFSRHIHIAAEHGVGSQFN